VVRQGPLLPRDAARARRGEELVEAKGGVGGYGFEVDGVRYGYAVHVPKGYDPARGSALLLDPGHGSWSDMGAKEKVEGFKYYRGLLDEGGGADWLLVRTEIVEQIGPDARGLPEETGNRIFQAMFADLATRYHLDPDRVYVTGLSQTGFWAWELGCTRADRYAGIAPMSAVTWEVRGREANLLALPVYVLHGSQDPVCPVGQPRETCSELARIGVPVVYREVPGGKHEPAVWNNLPDGLRWMQRLPRDRYPRRISKSLQTTQDGWCYWVRIDELAKEGTGRANEPPTAGLDAEIEGQEVRLFSEGVERVTLCLASEMLDLGKPVKVTWNGKEVFQGQPVRSLEVLLTLAAAKTDWKATFEAALALKAP